MQLKRDLGARAYHLAAYHFNSRTAYHFAVLSINSRQLSWCVFAPIDIIKSTILPETITSAPARQHSNRQKPECHVMENVLLTTKPPSSDLKSRAGGRNRVLRYLTLRVREARKNRPTTADFFC